MDQIFLSYEHSLTGLPANTSQFQSIDALIINAFLIKLRNTAKWLQLYEILIMSFPSAYASPNTKSEGGGKNKDDKQHGGNNQTVVSSATTPLDSNGFLKVSPSQG